MRISSRISLLFAIGSGALLQACGRDQAPTETPNLMSPRRDAVNNYWTVSIDGATSPRYLDKLGKSKDTIFVTVRDSANVERFDRYNSITCDVVNIFYCDSRILLSRTGGWKVGFVVSGANANSDATIKATLGEGIVSISTSQIIYRLQAVQSLTISPIAPNVTRGNSLQFTSTAVDLWSNNVASKFPATYTSSNTSVGTITSGGLFTASGCGTTTITVQRTDGFSNPTASTAATVTSRCVASLSFVNDSANFDVGSTRQYYINGVLDNNGASWNEKIPLATWTSSNPSVVSISGTGLATSHAVGTATLSATIEGISHSVSATVYPTLSLGIYGPRKVTITASTGCDFQAQVSGGTGSGYTYWWNRDGADIGTSSSVSNVYFDDYFDVALSVKDSAGNRKVIRYWLAPATGFPTAGCYDFGTTTVSGSPP